MNWAYSTGREHGRLEALGEPAPTSLYDVSAKAADIGTAAHAMVEVHIDGGNPYMVSALLELPEEDRPKAVNAFDMYREWAAMSNLEVLHQEMQLVSEKYRFGGTPDAVGLVRGQLCLVDWKTSNAVYGDYLMQLAAYRVLWEEVHPDQPLTGGFHLCRFSKDHGDFAHHYFRELDGAWEMFRHLRAAYDYDRELKKRAA